MARGSTSPAAATGAAFARRLQFEYKDGRLSEKPLRNLWNHRPEIYWAGLAPSAKDILFAASRTTITL